MTLYNSIYNEGPALADRQYKKIDLKRKDPKAAVNLGNSDRSFNKIDCSRRRRLLQQFVVNIETTGESEILITYYNITLYDIIAPLFSLCRESMERVRGIEPP